MPLVERICEECGRKFETRLAYVKRGEGRFCGRRCKNKFVARKRRAPNATCEYCGVPYHRKPSLLEKTRFCSRTCKDKARDEETNRRIARGVARYWENAPEEHRTKCAELALRNRPKVSKTGSAGSKAEIYCHERLSAILPYHVKWHDRDLVRGAEIDMTIPELKVAIEWMGRAHREPIFGLKAFERQQQVDKKKKEVIEALGWKYIAIEDNNRVFDKGFVEEQVRRILSKIGY